MRHLDSYTLIKIILRKVTNTSSMIVVQSEDLTEDDWRHPIVTSNFKRITGIIDDSLEKYFTQKQLIKQQFSYILIVQKEKMEAVNNND